MKLPISVFIIAKNEEDRIGLTIKSVVGWVDEVIVVDSGSTDGTVKLAENLGAKVVFNEWKGYGPQKVFAENLCKSNWVLNLDADEEVSPELRDEIIAKFKPDAENLAYRLKIMALYPHQRKLPVIAAGTTQVRLYSKNSAGFKNSPVHDSVVLKDGVTEILLKKPVVHRSFRSHAHAIEKINFYTSMQAEDLFKKGRKPSLLKIILTGPFAFFKCYFLKNYIFYGAEGFVHAKIYAFSKVLRLVKAREKFLGTQH